MLRANNERYLIFDIIKNVKHRRADEKIFEKPTKKCSRMFDICFACLLIQGGLEIVILQIDLSIISSRKLIFELPPSTSPLRFFMQ